jgi:pyridoxal phosphate enzyme (YggS family)
MDAISHALQAVKERIAIAAKKAGRNAEEIQLLAVTKGFGSAEIREAFRCGQKRFAENYMQEGITKITELKDLPIEWHFIGPIQSNKTRHIAEHFDWVHSIDDMKIAQRLNNARPADLAPLQCCIQVNISEENSKSGAHPSAVSELAKLALQLPHLKLRGLMGIAAETDDQATQRHQFHTLAKLKKQLEAEGIILDTLSMGMSADLEAAISEGATLVRIGRAIFGART